MISLKERVRNALSRSGLLQKDLATRSDVSAPTISHILRGGQPRLDTYLKIDSALQVIEREHGAAEAPAE